MDVALSDEQEFFRQTTRKFLEAECPIAAVRSLEADPAGFTPDFWRRGAELGWTSMLVPDDLGGGSLSEHGLVDLTLVAEEMGRLVSPGPLLPVNVVASALAEHGTDRQRADVLPGLLAGEVVAAWCGPTPVDATVASDSVRLTGTVAPVEAGAQARHLLVTARTAESDVTQYLVDAGAPGVTVTPMEGLDLVRRFAEVRLDGVTVPAGSALGDAGAVERQLQIAVVLQCAETVGSVARMFEVTVEYVGDRYSFGRPLSSYQALKHRFADMKTWLEACQAAAAGAARAVAARRPDAAELVSAAKAYIGPAATEILQDCVQMHGGIGVTWEHDLHLYLRRATVNRAMYGTPADHRDRLAAMLLEV